MLKSGGTTLATIPKHTIWVLCVCGHAGSVLIKDLLARPKPPETVADVIANARCAQCGSKSVKEYRLSYEGASQQAMQGAEQGQRGGLAAVRTDD